MKHHVTFTTTLASLLFCFALPSVKSHAADVFSVNGGSGTSSGEGYEVTGTIGQMDTDASMRGEDFVLSDGYVVVVGTALTTGAPTLSIALTAEGAVMISWASDGNSYALEQSTDLKGSNWSAVGQMPVDDGTTTSVTLPMTKGNKFFRLGKP